MRSTSSCWLTPSWATTPMPSHFPGSATSCWAVEGSKATTDAPAGLSALPNVTTPTSVNGWGGSLVTTVTWSPTW
jgi:hypothetical protein